MANSELPRHRTHTPVASAVPTAVIALSVAGMLVAPIGTASAATGENFAGILENLATEQTDDGKAVVDVQDGILTVGDIAFTLPSGLEGTPVDGDADMWSFEGTGCSFTVHGLQRNAEDSFDLWDLAHSQTGDGFGNWLMGGYPESVYLDYVRYDTGTLSFNLVFLMDTAGDKVAGFMLVPNDTLRTFTEVVFTFPAETFESSLTLVDAMCQGAEPAGSAATVLRASDAISALKESRQPAVEEAKAATDEEEAATDEADEAEAEPADATDEAGADADEATGAEAEAAAGSYADGTYEASGKGIGGDVPVTVTIKDGAIESVEVGDNSETQGIGSNAIEQLPEQFVGLKTAEEVDALDGVSGATITSNALKDAVADCLEQASAGDAEATDEADADADKADEKDADAGKAEAGALADGTYEGTGKGIGGDVPVTVTVKDGAIESVEVGDNSETQGIGSNAIEQLPELIVEANGTEGVDGVSGATITSNAIFDAVDEALEQARG